MAATCRHTASRLDRLVGRALRSAGRLPSRGSRRVPEWATTGIPLRFMYVNAPGAADIRVHWTDHLDHKTGSTTWRTDRDGWLIGGDITLATHISDGHPSTPGACGPSRCTKSDMRSG